MRNAESVHLKINLFSPNFRGQLKISPQSAEFSGAGAEFCLMSAETGGVDVELTSAHSAAAAAVAVVVAAVLLPSPLLRCSCGHVAVLILVTSYQNV